MLDYDLDRKGVKMKPYGSHLTQLWEGVLGLENLLIQMLGVQNLTCRVLNIAYHSMIGFAKSSFVASQGNLIVGFEMA